MSVELGRQLGAFICWPNSQASFAEDLSQALTIGGLHIVLDNAKELYAPQSGQPHVSPSHSVIIHADIVIAVIDTSSMSDKRQLASLKYALSLGKRIILAPVESVQADQTPDHLVELPYVDFSPPRRFTDALSELLKKVNEHADWVGDHTQLTIAATNWRNRGRSRARLLVADDIQRASDWLRRQPMNSARVSDTLEAFLTASFERYNEIVVRGPIQRSFNLILAGVAALTILVGVFGFRYGHSLKELNTLEEAYHLVVRDLIQTADELARIKVDPVVHITNGDKGDIVLPQGWRQSVAELAGAVGTIHSKNDDFNAAGLLIKGEIISNEFYNEPLVLVAEATGNSTQNLVTALPRSDESAVETVMFTKVASASHSDLSIFTSIATDTSILLGDEIWRSDKNLNADVRFSLYSVSNRLPEGMHAVGMERLMCPSPFAMQGWVGQFSIQANQPVLNVTVVSSTPTPNKIAYKTAHTKVGAPVFDLNTGNILALSLSQRAEPDQLEAKGLSPAAVLSSAREGFGETSWPAFEKCFSGP